MGTIKPFPKKGYLNFKCPYFDRHALTLIELIVCTVIIGILSTTALPISRHFVRLQREEALKERLRQIREGIDKYREKMRQKYPQRPEESCYPSRLEDLVDERILRSIPLDPMTNARDWKTISTSDSKYAIDSDNSNIFDVRSAASATSLDDSHYSDW